MGDLATFKCPNCGSPLSAGDWDRASGLITCGFCKTIITAGAAPQAGGGRPFRERPEVPLPPRLTCGEAPTGLTISYRWFTPAAFFLLFFCVAWDSFLVFWYSMAIGHGAPWIMAVFPVAHVAVGAGLTYLVAAMFLNKTSVTVNGRSLSISQGPVPWAGNAEIPAETVDQLYCKASIGGGRNGPAVSYELWAAFRDGRSRKLISTGLTQDQALFIEQKIERALNIKDRAMPGELDR